jgi:hypothetical protein
MKHRTLDYEVDYLGRDGGIRGRERALVTVHEDGRRTLRALCEIFDSEVLRDVTYTVDAGYRPIEAFVRTTVRDRPLGSAWFRFRDGAVECEAETAEGERLSQSEPLAAPARSFLSHAVTGDVWHAASIAKDPGLGPQAIEPLPSCSPLHNGASAPSLGRWPLRAVFLGIEPVDSVIGRVEAEHIRYEEPTGELFLDTWCTADGDRVLLRMYYPPYESSYVLRSLRRG